MKKFVAVLSAAAMMTSLAACGFTADTANTAASSAETTASAAESTADTAAADSYKVAIVQQLDHASLDEIRVAIEKELDAKAAEKGITIEYKDFNGQNDATTLNQIGTEVVADGYDAIIPIATLAAQCMTTAAESTKTPVIYAAISDPAAADLTDIDYVTGTSDALNTQSIMDMMFAVQPDIQTVGLLYSNSEANSTTPIAEAKAYLDAKGIAYVEKTGNTNDEIMTAASSMVGQVDAVFTPTDNVVMAAAAAVSETLTKGGIPFYTGADSFVTAGAFATCGVNYTELGTYTADMALDILETGVVPAYHVMDGGIITVNTETAAALGFAPKMALAQARNFKLLRAKEIRNTCTYCSVGCGLLMYSLGDGAKNAKEAIYHIEGDPDHPVSRGALCPKGAGLLDYVHSENRLRYPQYRAPGSDKWQRISWDEAFNRIARLMKADRDANFIEKNEQGVTVNRWLSTGMLCASAASNETGMLTQKFVRSLGMLAVDNQARV